MNETKAVQHTPGPWRVDEGPNNWLGVVAVPIGVGAVLSESRREPRPPTLIARVRGGSTWDEECANARLIAAAPDLLAACEMAERVIVLDADTIDTLRAAISKARGQS